MTPRETPSVTGSRWPKTIILVALAIPAVLTAEVLLIETLYWARVTTFSSEPGRLRSWEPILGSDAVVLFLAPIASTVALVTILRWSLRLNLLAAFVVAALLSFGGWITALTMAINQWGA